ncbi:MAG: glycosyltransferase family 4 protein [Gammaproteobacteria bacterium]|nr:glycosyltransferase family 4 protein [Gammaproteobacteria bacterium]MBU1838167.1 glycosyltransferase family 4 protein [Alphaproteobacteria bacterium]
MKICLTANTSWYLYNFRATTISALIEQGHELISIAPEDSFSSKLSEMRCRQISLDIDSNGKGIFENISVIVKYISILRREAPDVVVSFTPKANILGGVAARYLGIPLIPNISGVGSQFNKSLYMHFLLKILYRISLRRSRTVFFQNEEDLTKFVEKRIVKKRQAKRLLGSGVDIHQFKFSPLPVDSGPITFLFVGRLLWDKGLRHFVEAAEVISIKYGKGVRFSIVGIDVPDNPNAVSCDVLKEWRSCEFIEYKGSSERVYDDIGKCSCVVMPSFYGEGVPKTLLEAASCGRPAITTDVPGCRDAIIDRKTGFLCAPQSTESLIAAVSKFLDISSKERQSMGNEARALAEAQFSDRSNIESYIFEIDQIGSCS